MPYPATVPLESVSRRCLSNRVDYLWELEFPEPPPTEAEWKEISRTRHGRFDSQELRALKKKMQIKEWGKNVKLGSWKEVVDKHGEKVAYTALRQGTLAHVPHTVLKEGHGVQWPDSHQFIMEESWWKASWREEVNFESNTEREITQSRIQEWLAENDPNFKNTDDLETLRAGATVGIPDNLPICLLYTSPSPRDPKTSRMPSSA